MCGRFTITVSYEQLQEYVQHQYHIPTLPLDQEIVPQFNVAPGSDIIGVIHDGKQHRIGLLKWWFIPTFSKDQKINIINAQAETLFHKPSFAKAAKFQRCIILADGFYEWKQDGSKQPLRITTGATLFAMAGIWNTIIDSQGKKLHTVAIITTAASPAMQGIHPRMPLILDSEKEKVWLDAQIHEEAMLQSVLTPYNGPLSMYPVSKKVNNARYNQSDVLEEVSESLI